MPDNNVFADVVASVRAATALGDPAPGSNAPGRTTSVFVSDQVERVTYHTFSTYETILDPWVSRDPRGANDRKPAPSTPGEVTAPPPPKYLPADVDELGELPTLAEAAVQYFIDAELRSAMGAGQTFDPAPIIELVYRFRYQCSNHLIREYQDPGLAPARADAMLLYFLENFAAEVIDAFAAMSAAQRADFFSRYFDPAVRDWVIRARAVEMPWTAGLHTFAEWEIGGYRVLPAFGKAPDNTNVEYISGPNARGVVVRSWAKDRLGNEVLAHEYAWTGTRRQGLVRAGQDTRADGLVYFAAYSHYVYGQQRYVTESPVLRGALDILAATPPPVESEADRLTREVRARLATFGVSLGVGLSIDPPVTAADRYGFTPYPVGSTNLGTRAIYQQAWRPRGIQPGELVRTVPLAPGQKERISVKVSRRDKVSRQLEERSSTESTDESTRLTKDSSEIVAEAAQANKWHADVSASGGFNIGIASLSTTASAGYARDSSNASKDTKSRLNEAMQRTARVSRHESRLSVSTEHEETFESEHASEITNPNQEIAVTCFYETVQQIYTVRTTLNGVEPVLLVAERVPEPSELGQAWIRRHDWILARALLDESFRETLELVSTQTTNPLDMATAGALGLDEVARLGAVLGFAEQSLAAIHELPGNIANTYEATLNAYQSAVGRARAKLDQLDQYAARVARLVDHFADNILHYCRAIWSAEDPQRRTMRYASLRIPTEFTPVIDPSSVQIDPITGRTLFRGTWAPVASSWVPLSEVIHPAGPIAYAGNYAVYRIRHSEQTAGLTRVIRQASQAYHEPVAPAVIVRPPARAAALAAAAAITNEDFYGAATYVLRVASPAPAPGGGPVIADAVQARLYRVEAGAGVVELTGSALPNNGLVRPLLLGPLRLDFDGIQLSIAGALQIGDELVVVPRAPRLVDPEIKYRRTLDPSLSIEDLARELEDENTTDIVVDTNNLWLNLVRGAGTVLEDFKLQHRLIDVEVARAELIRRHMRLAQNVLGDPDVEKNVVINGPPAGGPP